jgi:hypothetical protein
MILVKSLIVLFSILLFYYLYNKFVQTTKKCPGIEGFKNNPTKGKKRENYENYENYENKNITEENYEEQTFKAPSSSIIEKHNSVSNDASMINDLQIKLNDLLQLSNEAQKIKV